MLIGLLVLGLGAVGFDRFVLGTGETDPATAAAQYAVTSDDGSSTATASTTSTTIVSDAVSAKPMGPSIAQCLRQAQQRQSDKLNNARNARNALTPDASWYGDQPTAAAANPSKIDPVDQFLRTHTLSAVMNNRIAIVNGQPYRVGDTLVDFRLVAVGSNSATFQFKDQMIDLTLSDALPASR